MNYIGKKIAITGHRGFLGGAIIEGLLEQGVAPSHITILDGDIRDPETFESLDHTYDYLFHFAAPSSQVLFKRAPAFCIQSTIQGFINAAAVAKANNIRLVYPSTGILSQGKSNEYARCKQICEDWALNNAMDAIGLRIFATYGPGEGHKRDYASPPYLFARDLSQGRAPVLWGDGSQVRDFVYVTDVVKAILVLAEEATEKIVDIGSGQQVSFTEIVQLLQRHIGGPDPSHVPAPDGYVSETLADTTILEKYHVLPRVRPEKGMELLADSLKMTRTA